MKNMKTIILTGFMIVLGYTGIQAFGMGADPDTYSPSPATTNFIEFVIENPLNGTIDSSTMYCKYYPELNPAVATIKQSSDNKMLYKFTDVVAGGIDTPEGKVLIGSYIVKPAKATSGQPQHMGIRMMTVYGVEQK